MEPDLTPLIDLALAQGADYAEARYQSDSYESNLLRNGISEVSSFETRRGVSVRVLADGGLGFGATGSLSKSDLRMMVQRTVRSAKASARVRKEPIRMGDAEMAKGSVEKRPRVKFEDVELEDRISLLKEADSYALDAAEKAGIKLAGRHLSMDVFVTEKHIVNSDGADFRSRIPRAEVDIMLTAVEPTKGSGQRVFSIGESGGWEAVERWDLPSKLRKEVLTLGEVLRTAQPFEGGSMDVVLGQEVVGIVSHESAGHPGEADRMLGREAAQAGETYLKQEDLGKQIGSEVVNVVDDPTLDRSFGFYLSDDEGVKARRRYLIKEGRAREFLHDRETAYKMGTASNGSSRSVAYYREPIVRMANTFVEPSDHSVDELIEGVRKGAYIKNFMEWNIDDRRYNQRYVGLEAYAIENGRLGARLKNPVLEITTPALWSAIDAVGNDIEFAAAHCGKGDPMQAIPVWTGGPHVRLRNIRLGGSK